VEIGGAGVVVVNAAKLTALAKETAGDTLELATGADSMMSVKGGGGRWRLQTMPGDDFPPLPEHKAGTTARVKTSSLLTGIRRVAYAASTDEARYALNGLDARLQGAALQLTATDGHRLTRVAVPLEEPATAAPVIIPRAALKTLESVFKGAGDEATVALSDNWLDVAADNARVGCRLIEGAFPNADAVIPKEHPVTVRVSNKALAEALRKVVFLSEERNHPVKLMFKGAELKVFANSTEHGDAEVTLPLSAGEVAQEIAIGFNASYVSDYLGVAPSEVSIALKDALSPALFTGEGAPLYVVMPLRI
jgi:DNA polymerase-3 subunit beta